MTKKVIAIEVSALPALMIALSLVQFYCLMWLKLNYWGFILIQDLKSTPEDRNEFQQ